jgi:hypothetical protein
MADFKISRLRYTWKGEWTSTTTYYKDDVVSYSGSSWVCIRQHTASAFADDQTFLADLSDTEISPAWIKMTDGYEFRNNWQPETLYNIGNLVRYYGYVYRCIDSHTSAAFESFGLIEDIEKWQVTVASYNWLNEWATQEEYNLGDIVRYGGFTYLCIESHESAEEFNSGLELDQQKWQLINTSDRWTTDWIVNQKYILGDIVKYDNIVYRCVVEHVSTNDIDLGLEENQTDWQIVNSGIEYKFDWQPNFKYKTNNIIKKNSTLWISIDNHISTENFENDSDNWQVWIPGFGYESVWQFSQKYFKGDVVSYGGWTYVALENSIDSIPSVNGKDQNTGDWQLLTEGYSFAGEWNNGIEYKPGEVVRNNGYLYKSIANSTQDSTQVYPDSDLEVWRIIVPGIFWRAEWLPNIEYFLGDIVTVRGTTYNCIQRHTSTEQDRPDLDTINQYWIKLIQGEPSNVLQYKGDIKIRDNSENNRLPIGLAKQVLKVNQVPTWGDIDEVTNIYYVSTNGIDASEFGRSISSAFRTIKFASEYILQDPQSRTPATIFVKTGFYEEILPIIIPANVAIVGDELRSTTVTPAAGFEQANMFLMRNGSGLRNMTLQGLSGELSDPNEFLTRRPTAGAYVSLDPGTGPTDQSVWISTKSPYVQNVSTFGTGCIGMKIDGALHNGGNRSIVANDFTQILSDGIGYWADNIGRSELVSVFTYYCHIGYLSTNGGVLRGTNGNNSYGEFGSVAEGVDQNEIPILGKIDNRRNQAIVVDTVTFGTNQQRILAIGYRHAGQEYNSANIEFTGSGVGALGAFDEFRDNAISQLRVIDAEDSVPPGGLNYQFVVNTAQTGGNGFIRLSQADIGTPELYVGMRIVILSGQGVGQYGYITGFDSVSKGCIISRESDDGNGWDHLQPGWPIESVLDETTRYAIEPRVSIEEPEFVASSSTVPSSNPWKYITHNGEKFIAVDETTNGDTTVISSIDGNVWVSNTATSGYLNRGIVWTGERFIILHNNFNGSPTDKFTFSTDGDTWNESTFQTTNFRKAIATDKKGRVVVLHDGNSQTVDRSNNHGATWNTSTISVSSIVWTDIAYGNGKFVVVSDASGEVAYSTNNGETWVVTNSALDSINWDKVVYGNGRFVALSIGGGDSTIQLSRIAYSFDGITWYNSEPIPGEFNNISYGAGVFLLTAPGNFVVKSQDGKVWREFDESSTFYTTTEAGNWQQAAYGNGQWVLTNFNSSNFNKIKTGAVPIIRATVQGSRVTDFIIYDPGSNYEQEPIVNVFDPRSTANVVFDIRINDGVLAQPEMLSRGTGYFTARATITGDGFADIYQTGDIINFKELSLIPRPGANIRINGLDTLFFVVKVESENEVSQSSFNATVRILPNILLLESPEHETDIELRIRYSQIRLTGHDFLDIGTGNFESTNYPELYLEGVSPDNDPKPFQETAESGGGRVFYTSTDQDGNFRVGNLFEVRQASGSVTINASLFNLEGLTELRLGGIRVGSGSNVVIREFSREGTFAADSNNIIPTQAAILKYVTSRITGGTSGAGTGRLVAGQIEITSNFISTTSGLQIDIPRKVNMLGGIGGKYLALQYYRANEGFSE